MNNAGLPGTGLGGLFYILLALAMPLVELYRTARGRSSVGRWREVGTQFALACGILAMTAASTVAYLHVADAPSPFGLHGSDLALAPVVLAGSLLAVLVVVLRVWARVQRPDPGPVPPGPGRHKADAGERVCAVPVAARHHDPRDGGLRRPRQDSNLRPAD